MKHYILAAITILAAHTTATAQRTLSLDECLALAKKNNYTLKNAVIDINMADEQKQEARTNYYPEIEAQVMAFHSFDKLMKGDGVIPNEIAGLGEQFASLAGQPYSYGELNKGYSATVSAMMPLYAGGRITNGNKLAKVQTDVMRLQREIKELEVEQKVTENYWQIASVKYNLETLDAADKQVETAEKIVTDYLNAGLTTRNDLLKVQLRKQELASDRVKLNNAEHLLRLLLAQMIGLAGEDIDINATSLRADDPSSVFISSDIAVANRRELQLAQKGIEAQELQVKMERGKHMPTVAAGVVGLHSNFGGLSSTVKNYVNTSLTNALVMVSVSVPISSWWGGKHAIKREQMRLQQSRNEMAEAREQLQIDIESAWSNLREAHDQVAIAQKSVEQAQENMRITADQHRAGTIDLNDLLDAETLLRQARSQLSSSLASYQIQRSAYLQKIQ